MSLSATSVAEKRSDRLRSPRQARAPHPRPKGRGNGKETYPDNTIRPSTVPYCIMLGVRTSNCACWSSWVIRLSVDGGGEGGNSG